MYQIILALHSLLRWLVLFSLLFALYRAYNGWLLHKTFSPFDNAVRHWTATSTHIQLLAGFFLYFISPLTEVFLSNFSDAMHENEIRFFGMEHALMMLAAVALITVGSARAKRKPTDAKKFKTIALWFSIGLLIILVSIPWPFSPFAARPYFRTF